MAQGAAKESSDQRLHTPESIRGWLADLVKDLARPDYYGEVVVNIKAKRGQIYHYAETKQRTR